jgi:uncharacterized protein YndB with AHSA1/START domain
MSKFIKTLGVGLAICTAITFTARADSSPPALLAPIENSAVVDAPIEDVWKAWTTSEGPPTFVCFGAEIEATPGGVYRVICNVDGKTPLDRGNDGRVVAIEPMKMLSVTWMTPMHMQSLRGNSTSLVLYFEKIDDGRRTLVRLVNTGYGVGEEWDAAYQYNVRGWDRVLSALEYRFKNGPIDMKWAATQLKDTGKMPWWRNTLAK